MLSYFCFSLVALQQHTSGCWFAISAIHPVRISLRKWGDESLCQPNPSSQAARRRRDGPFSPPSAEFLVGREINAQAPETFISLIRELVCGWAKLVHSPNGDARTGQSDRQKLAFPPLNSFSRRITRRHPSFKRQRSPAIAAAHADLNKGCVFVCVV